MSERLTSLSVHLAVEMITQSRWADCHQTCAVFYLSGKCLCRAGAEGCGDGQNSRCPPITYTAQSSKKSCSHLRACAEQLQKAVEMGDYKEAVRDLDNIKFMRPDQLQSE